MIKGTKGKPGEQMLPLYLTCWNSPSYWNRSILCPKCRRRLNRRGTRPDNMIYDCKGCGLIWELQL